MREIKFRAWDKTTNQMMDVVKINFRTGEVSLGYFANPSLGSRVWQMTEVELEQFTGREDNAGVEIYEEDILEHWSNSMPKGSNPMVRQVVRWNRHKTCFENCRPFARIIGHTHQSYPEPLEKS